MASGGPRGAGSPWRRTCLLVAGAVALFFVAALDPALQFGHRDSGRLHHPVKRWIAAELRAGRFPEWNPYAGLGTPVVAAAVDAPQHPFNLLFLALPFDPAFKAWVLLSYLGAALGGVAWGRALGASPPAAAACGLGFALSGFLLSASANLTYLTTLAALPALFAAATRLARTGGVAPLALTAAAAAACAAGGDPQAWAIAVLLLVPYCAVAAEGPGASRRGAARGLLAAAAAFAASAPFVLPVLAWSPHTSRAAAAAPDAASRWNLHPLRVVELAIPHLVRPLEAAPVSEVYRVFAGDALSPIPWADSVYCGAALVALAILGALRSRIALALCAAAGALTWMALGPAGGFGALAARLPVIGALRYWEKLAGWPALLLAPAAALGLDALARGTAGRPWRRAVLALGAAALAAGAGARVAGGVLAAALRRGPGTEVAAGTLAVNLADGLLAAGAAALALAGVALLLERGRISARQAAWAAAAVVLLDLAGAGAGVAVLLRRDALEPPAPLADALARRPGLTRVVTPFELTEARFRDLAPFESIWTWGSRTLAPSWNVARRVGNLEPYVALVPRRLALVLHERPALQVVPIAGLWGVAGVVVPKDPALVAPAGLAPPFEILAADPALPASVVAIPHRPRAYLAARTEARSEAGALAFALDPGSARGDLTVVEGPARPTGPGGGDAEIVEDQGDRLLVRTRADGAALLILNDAFAPGWSASVDGAPAPILAANYLARGVWTPPGAHAVEFRYRTPLWREGLACAAALALVLGAAAWRARRTAPGSAP